MSTKNKNQCECELDFLVITSYWWTKPEWIFNHPGINPDDYYVYRGKIAGYPREMFLDGRQFRDPKSNTNFKCC